MSRYLDDPKPGVDAVRGGNGESRGDGGFIRSRVSAQPQRSTERWEEVETAFAHVLELEPQERERYLADLDVGDSGLSFEVRSLLKADGSAGAFLDEPILPNVMGDEDGGLLTSPGESPMPEAIGGYRVLSRLGAGGMSDVFLAERTDGVFSQQVAIKLIRAEIVSDELVRRFETERQILAQLAHPNIAGLLDGGRTETGLPYLVMEYIEGLPIDEYCDSERLTVDQRLELFLPVCAAVQYAHRNLIVHRDIKTSNILVTPDGTPKLLDFGIAKLLSPESFPLDVEKTATRLRPMTPYYASPEQIENGPITTATDVYSLGVLLYKLLTGQFPHDFEGLHARGVEEKILGEPMVPLVEAVEADASRMASLSAERATKFGFLRRVLAGDVSVVVGMALRKEADRRYDSVDQLASDIACCRKGLPVVARGDSLSYRAIRFLGRNRLSSGLAAALALLLIAFTVVMAVQSARLKEERDQVLAERDRGDQVIDLLQGVFGAADPMSENSRELTARDVLETAASRIRGELDRQPIAQVELLVAIGNVLKNLGFYDEAEAELMNALAIEVEEAGQTLAHGEAYLALGLVQRDQGRFETAQVSLERARELFSLAERGEFVSKARGALGSVFRLRGDHESAAEEYGAAIAYLDRSGTEPVALSEYLNDLGIIRSREGDFPGGRELLGRALTLRRNSLPEDHPLIADSLNDLAVLYGIQGRYELAEEHFTEAHRLRTDNLGPDHPLLAVGANNLARVRKELGDYDSAEQWYEESIRIVRMNVGPEHPDLATGLHNLGMLYLETSRLQEARALLEQSLSIRRDSLGEEHRSVGLSLSSLGRVELAFGAYEVAERHLREATRIQSDELGEAHWRVAETGGYLGEALVAQSRFDEAAPLVSRAHERLEAVLGSEHRRTETALQRVKNLTLLDE